MLVFLSKSKALLPSITIKRAKRSSETMTLVSSDNQAGRHTKAKVATQCSSLKVLPLNPSSHNRLNHNSCEE